jgi:hypothetical protein
MEIDESIVQLVAKLDEWFDGNHATFASRDRVAQGKALLSGIELVKRARSPQGRRIGSDPGTTQRAECVLGRPARGVSYPGL